MKRLLTLSAAAAALLAACATTTIPDQDFGLRKTAALDTTAPVPFDLEHGLTDLPKPPPGSGQPPMIGHGVEQYLPITAKKNDCLDCHDEPKAIGKPVAKGDAAPMPANHYVKPGTAAVAGNRYECMACHAPQARVPPLVGNRG